MSRQKLEISHCCYLEFLPLRVQTVVLVPTLNASAQRINNVRPTILGF